MHDDVVKYRNDPEAFLEKLFQEDIIYMWANLIADGEVDRNDKAIFKSLEWAFLEKDICQAKTEILRKAEEIENGSFPV